MKTETGRGSASAQSVDAEYVFAVRLGGQDREIAGLKVSPRGDYYAFVPYARLAEAPADIHSSYHASGKFHFRVRRRGKIHAMPETEMQLQPISVFSGVKLLLGSDVSKGGFLDLPCLGSNNGKVVLLDGDSAGFRDDVFFIRVYLVEPDHEREIPTPADLGPFVRHMEKSITPWVAIEAYQQQRTTVGGCGL